MDRITKEFYKYVISLGKFQEYNYIEIDDVEDLIYVLLPISLFKHDVKHLDNTITSTNMDYYVDYVIFYVSRQSSLHYHESFYVYSDGEFRNTTKEEQLFLDGNLRIDPLIIDWDDINNRKYPKLDLREWKDNFKRTEKAMFKMNEHKTEPETFEIKNGIKKQFYRYILKLDLFSKFQDYEEYEVDQDKGLSISLLPAKEFNLVDSSIEYVIVGTEADVMSVIHFFYVYQNGEFRETTEEEDEILEETVEGEDTFIYFDNYPTMTTHDWWENRKRTERAMFKINEAKSETFEEWLSIRLQNKLRDKIGRGNEGSVYDLNINKVIKISTVDIIQQYNLLNKNIKGFVKVYHIGYIVPPQRFMNSQRTHVELKGSKKIKDFRDFNKTSQDIHISKDGRIGYIIMEKVDTSIINEMHHIRELLYTTLFENGEIINTLGNLSVMKDPFLRMNTLFHLFTYVRTGYGLLINYLNKFDFPELVYEMLEVFESVSKVYPKWTDIHTGQFGRNRKGELVVFDVSNDNEKLFGTDLHKFYPTPKNIIRESNDIKGSLRGIPSDVQKAYINFIQTNKTFQEECDGHLFYVNKGGYIDDCFDVNIYLLDLNSAEGNEMGFDGNIIDVTKRYDYLIKLKWQNSHDSGATYYVYHEGRFQQITTDDGYVDSFENLDGNNSNDIQWVFDIISQFGYEDWAKNKAQTTKAIFKMNEEIDIFGVDSERVVPKSLEDIPDKVKRTYIKFIQQEMCGESDWFESHTYAAPENSKGVMYLIDGVDLAVRGEDDELIKYTYVIKKFFFDSDGLTTQFFVYVDEKNVFMDATKISAGIDVLWKEYYKHDRFKELDDRNVISRYSYMDWIKHKAKTFNAVKKMNR